MQTMRHFPPPKVPRITATPHCTRWREQETTEKQNALDRAAAAVTASDAETLQAELDALLAVQQAGGTLTAQ